MLLEDNPIPQPGVSVPAPSFTALGGPGGLEPDREAPLVFIGDSPSMTCVFYFDFKRTTGLKYNLTVLLGWPFPLPSRPLRWTKALALKCSARAVLLRPFVKSLTDGYAGYDMIESGKMLPFIYVLRRDTVI